MNSSSLPAASERLVRAPLERLRPHPANAKRMDPERRAKLTRHVARSGRYPPIVVRPQPDEADAYQILDGHDRDAVLRELGADDALRYVWPCDDQAAPLLLATLNRLQGEDSPGLRASLLEGPCLVGEHRSEFCGPTGPNASRRRPGEGPAGASRGLEVLEAVGAVVDGEGTIEG